MKYKNWVINQNDDSTQKDDNAPNVNHLDGIHPLVASTLISRGIYDIEKANDFLTCDNLFLHDPFLLNDMHKAVERINFAVENNQKMAIYGDYDVDGITSVVLLVRYFRKKNIDVEWYVPNRMSEGYGMNTTAIDELKTKGVQLIITVDTGITAIEEVKYAKSINIDTIITDHHTCREELPCAVAIVNPWCSENYPFKGLAGVGVAYKLALALESPKIIHDFDELVALGTVADVMKVVDENRLIIRTGMNKLKNTSILGLHALLKEVEAIDRPMNTSVIGFQIAPKINAAGRLGKAYHAIELFLTDDADKAKYLAEMLCEMNTQRQQFENIIIEQTENFLKTFQKSSKVFVFAGEDWHSGVIGVVASKLCERYVCPVLLVCFEGDTGKGSARSVDGINLVDILDYCSDILVNYGGHTLAAGFTVMRENWQEFVERVQDYCNNSDFNSEKNLFIDCKARPNWLTKEAFYSLSKLEPYGSGNSIPVYLLENAEIIAVTPIGAAKHIKIRICSEKFIFTAIWFGVSVQALPFSASDIVDVAFKLEMNRFRDEEHIQLHLVDLRLSKKQQMLQDTCRKLYDSYIAGNLLSDTEKKELHPNREEMVDVWRFLLRDGGKDINCSMFLLAREVLRNSKNIDSYAKVWITLEVFHEFNFITLVKKDDIYYISVNSTIEKTDLSLSKILLSLKTEE